MRLTPIVRRRLRRLLPIALCIAGAVGFALYGLSENVTYFYTPSELAAKTPRPTNRIRVGGLVPAGGIVRNGADVDFVLTDTTGTRLNVRFRGITPDLFRAGQGAVAEGRLSDDGTFIADTLLAKHDEKYMPPELKGKI